MRSFRLGSAFVLALTLLLAACSHKPASLEISQKRIRIYGLQRSQRISARVLDKKGRTLEKSVPTFSSSKADVVSVDSSGKVVALGEGKAMVTVSFEKLSTQIPVEVVDVKSIDVLPASIRLAGPLGMQFPLQAVPKNSKDKPVALPAVWSSSKPAIASVSPEGVVTSVSPGRTTLMVKVGDVEAACDVTVAVRDITRLEVRPATAIVRAGDSQKFEILGFGPDGRTIEDLNAVFTSSDAAVAKVDPTGNATGVASGAVTIRATIGTVKAESTLIVN
jgi:uncharacterized protein YjdB